MTREEAKGRLESFIDTFNICKEHDNALVAVSISKEDIQAFTQAIKALEQQPCEDAISRKDMLAVFRQSNSLSQAWNGFEKLPPVTPKEKSEYEHDHDAVKAYNDGQAYILDKIRAEVEQRQKEQSNHYGNEIETAKYDSYDDCLDVIDKYREVSK